MSLTGTFSSKVGKMLQFYKQQGGLKNFLKTMIMTKEFYGGELKGVDDNGNKYYENLDRTPGRTRFVIYANPSSYDPSQVPPEWHAWLHFMGDKTPIEDPPSNYIYRLKHIPMKPSDNGVNANYLPPGHYLRKEDRYGMSPAAKYEPYKDATKHLPEYHH